MNAIFLEELKYAIGEFYNKPIDEKNLTEIKSFYAMQMQTFRHECNIPYNMPLFNHDCFECTYLGDYTYCKVKDDNTLNLFYFDLFFHKRDNLIEFIARYDDEPSSYLSFSYFTNLTNEEESQQLKTISQLDVIKEVFNRYKEINEVQQ